MPGSAEISIANARKLRYMKQILVRKNYLNKSINEYVRNFLINKHKVEKRTPRQTKSSTFDLYYSILKAKPSF